MAKKATRARNWKKYNKALISRGSITLWINEKTLKKWAESQEKKRGRGRPRIYSDVAIETCVILRVLFNLPYRQCVDFIGSLCHVMRIEIKIPSFTQICRRQAKTHPCGT
jgi:hypothetical protein